MPCRLLCPPVEGRSLPPLRHGFAVAHLAVRPWPWQETMLTAFNSYMLWIFTWLQFVITLSGFSYSGRNLWFYTEIIDPFGLNIPDTFFVFSILLSVFAVSAVIGSTRKTPRLWKRIFCVSLFAGFAIGLSILNQHLRHYTYSRAIESRDVVHDEYRYNLRVNHNTADYSEMQFLEWQRRLIKEYDTQISRYRMKYGIQ